MAPLEGWLRRDGVDLHYLEWRGDGAPRQPAVLMLHGLSSNARYWERTAGHLSGRRVVALDQRGHGLTGSRPLQAVLPGGYAMRELLADAAFVAAELELGAPVVVGHSWGAAVALEFAARHPRLASALVFVDGPVQGVGSALSWQEVEALMQPPLPRYASREDAITASRADFESAWGEDLLPFVDARLMGDGDAWVLTLTSAIRHELLRGLYESLTEELWPLVQVPAVVLVARHTMARISRSTEAGLARLRELAPSVEVRRFETPHDIPLYAPAEVAQEVERVARRAESARSTI